jgi:hypothetical protein
VGTDLKSVRHRRKRLQHLLGLWLAGALRFSVIDKRKVRSGSMLLKKSFVLIGES